MTYEILVEGGFTGIPKRYAGEIIEIDEVREILNVMEKQVIPSEKIRDGLQYKITLVSGDKKTEADFDETNLPEAIRQLLVR